MDLLESGEGDGEGGAGGGGGEEAEGAAVEPYYLAAEAEPYAAPAGFGGDEGLEQGVADTGVHAAAVVGHGDVGTAVGYGGCDRDFGPFGALDCVKSVAHKVYHRLAHEGAVDA